MSEEAMDNYDNLSSPECLMTSEPVKDPYSTDEEKCCLQEEYAEPGFLTSSDSQSITTYSSNDLTLQELKQCFNLKFYPLPKGPTFEETINLDMPEILDYITHFVTNTNEIPANIIMNYATKEFNESPLDTLITNKDFHIDFKKRQAPLPGYKQPVPYNYHMSYVFMRKMAEALYLSQNPNPIDTACIVDTVKGWMSQLIQLTFLEVISNGSCIYEVESAVPSFSNGEDKHRYAPNPDLVIRSPASNTCPGIPIKIYSPENKAKNVIRTKATTRKAKSNEASCKQVSEKHRYEDSIETLVNLLSNNIPVYKCEKLKRFDSKFKEKLVAQHILQVISMASQNSYSKYHKNQEPLLTAQVFIGIFVYNEFIYITKIQGDENQFLKYSTEYNKDRMQRIVNREDLLQRWMCGNVPDFDPDELDPCFHVQFCPVGFDMSVHNHRLALILFISYYMDNRAKMTCLDMRK